MSQISSNDLLFASATIMGRRFFNYSGTGIGSLSDLIARVRREASALSGMVTLTVRNSSRGWSQSRDFYLSA